MWRQRQTNDHFSLYNSHAEVSEKCFYRVGSYMRGHRSSITLIKQAQSSGPNSKSVPVLARLKVERKSMSGSNFSVKPQRHKSFRTCAQYCAGCNVRIRSQIVSKYLEYTFHSHKYKMGDNFLFVVCCQVASALR